VAVAVPYNANITDDVSPTTDMDFMEFEGNAGTIIEIIVAGGTDGLDSRIELRDPDGELIGDESCSTPYYQRCTATLNATLSKTGTYQIAVSDQPGDEGGTYSFGLQCLYGFCPNFLPSWPECNVEMDADLYLPGDDVIANVLQLANPGAASVPVEVKTWFETPAGAELAMHNVGTDGSLVLAPTSVRNFGPIHLATVPLTASPGWYSFNCRIVSPVTGWQLSFEQTWVEVR